MGGRGSEKMFKNLKLMPNVHKKKSIFVYYTGERVWIGKNYAYLILEWPLEGAVPRQENTLKYLLPERTLCLLDHIKFSFKIIKNKTNAILKNLFFCAGLYLKATNPKIGFPKCSKYFFVKLLKATKTTLQN